MTKVIYRRTHLNGACSFRVHDHPGGECGNRQADSYGSGEESEGEGESGEREHGVGC